MKRIAFVLLAALIMAPIMFAQDHGEVGAFVDLTRLQHANNTNFIGVGGRVGFNVHRSVQLEAEMTYDFERSFTNTGSTSSVISSTTNTTRTGLRLINGLFGPKFQTGGGAIRAFVTVKGGFLNFGVNNGAANGTSFTSQLSSFGTGDTNGVFYPGGGIEFFAGPIGLRAEVGDMMYFDRGANNNLRFTLGPQIRF